MPIFLILIGAIGLAVIFPPIIFIYFILGGLIWLAD
jgi:hypothetical protein